jgi:hypothetical protein
MGNWLLNTAPIPDKLWLLLIVFGAGMLTLEELRKLIVRKMLGSKIAARTVSRRQ